MNQKLFPNIKKINTLFCIAVISVILIVLVLRLTVLSGMAEAAGGPDFAAGKSKENNTAEEPVTVPDFSYKINSKIYFADVDSKGNFKITNSSDSKYNMKIDIINNKTQSSVYYTGNMVPGASLTNAYLHDKSLEEGEHECTAVITVTDPETKETIETINVPVTIYVGVKP